MPELGKSGSVGALGGQPPKATRPPLFFGTALTGGYRFMTSFPMVLAVLFRSPLDLKPRCDGLRNFSALASLRNLQPSGSLSLSGSRLFSRSRRKAAIPAALHMRLSACLCPPKIRDGLGKIQRNPPIMAIRLFLDRDHAKAGDNPGAGLGKILRESPIMAISKGWPWS